MSELLRVIGVKKSYKKREIVRGLGIHIDNQEIIGLLGPNGAGKTTTFNIITGTVPLDEGKIIFRGMDVTKMPMYKRARRGMGYLGQEASIFRNLKVEDNLLAIIELFERNKTKQIQEKDRLLERFKLGKVAKQLAITLSGGERRRLEIARALVCRPKILMLDEPFSGVDPIAVEGIKKIMFELRDDGISLLITDHNVRETLDLVDRAYIIFDGKILSKGSREELIADKNVQQVYLGDSFKL